MSPVVVVDTNVMVRIVTGAPVDQALQARDRFVANPDREDEFVLLPIVVAEVLFVLGGTRMGLPRGELVSAVQTMLDLELIVVDRNVIERALDHFRATSLPWLDCYLAAHAEVLEDGAILSFDRDFDRLSAIEP